LNAPQKIYPKGPASEKKNVINLRFWKEDCILSSAMEQMKAVFSPAAACGGSYA